MSSIWKSMFSPPKKEEGVKRPPGPEIHQKRAPSVAEPEEDVSRSRSGSQGFVPPSLPTFMSSVSMEAQPSSSRPQDKTLSERVSASSDRVPAPSSATSIVAGPSSGGLDMFAGLSLKPSSKKFEPVAFELPSSIPTSKGVSSPPSDPVPAVPVTTHLSNDVSFEAPSSAFSFLSPSASDASIPQIPIATAAQSIPAETGFSFLGSSSAVHAPVSAQTPVPTHTIASGDHEDEDNHSEGSIGRSTIASEALEMGTMSPLRGFDSVERRFPISESKDASPSRVMEKSLKESSEHSVHSGHSNRSSTSADPGHLAAKLAITSQFAPTSSEKKKDKLGQLEEEVFNLERKIRSSMLELEQSLTKHWKNVESLNVEQKELQQRHADLEKQVRSLEHKVIDCEHQQQKFIDEEDFEKAEHLNVQLEDLRLKIEHCKSEQIRVIHARQTLEERRVKFTEESSNRIHDFISKIRDLQKENVDGSVVSSSDVLDEGSWV